MTVRQSVAVSFRIRWTISVLQLSEKITSLHIVSKHVALICNSPKTLGSLGALKKGAGFIPPPILLVAVCFNIHLFGAVEDGLDVAGRAEA